MEVHIIQYLYRESILRIEIGLQRPRMLLTMLVTTASLGGLGYLLFLARSAFLVMRYPLVGSTVVIS